MRSGRAGISRCEASFRPAGMPGAKLPVHAGGTLSGALPVKVAARCISTARLAVAQRRSCPLSHDGSGARRRCAMHFLPAARRGSFTRMDYLALLQARQAGAGPCSARTRWSRRDCAARPAVRPALCAWHGDARVGTAPARHRHLSAWPARRACTAEPRPSPRLTRRAAAPFGTKERPHAASRRAGALFSPILDFCMPPLLCGADAQNSFCGAGCGTGSMNQVSCAYSRIVRSEENLPADATLMRHLRPKAIGLRVS